MKRWLTLSLLLATVVAMGLRCPRLGQRPMHNDEAVNALKFRQLWERGEYRYDPKEHHGPSLAYATLAAERLTDAPDFDHLTEARLRFVTVVFGVGLVLLLPLTADGLGRRAVAWAAVFTAVSPAMVFYSRYYIHEMLLVFFTFLMMVASWHYWRSRKIGWALLAGAAIGLMAATKETFVITLGSAGLALFLNQIWNRLLDASKPPASVPRLRPGHLAAAFAVWLAVAALLFSSFFTNASGPLDSLRTYGPWLNRAGGDSPHIHPWDFYLHRLVYFHAGKGPMWSEALILMLGIIGAGAGFVRKGLGDGNASFVRFVALYTLLLTAVYSLLAYKTPWCLLSFWHGFILLAGVGAAVLVHTVRRPFARIALTILFLAGAGQLAAQAWQASHDYSADPGNPYVYVQTAPDILNLVDQVTALAEFSPEGHRMVVKVMADEGDYWPLPWYLRRFERIGWWAEMPPDPWAPVMIVSAKFGAALDEKKTHRMVGIFALRPGVFFELYVDAGLWRDYMAKRPAKTD